MTQHICPCGTPFEAKPSAAAKGGAKYCSPACYYHFVRGDRRSDWRGDDVSYAGLHAWIRRLRGRPQKCEFCGKVEGNLEWANKSHEYKRVPEDWMSLCVSCHRRYDATTCRRGHEWTPENTRIRGPGWRRCRICATDARQRRRANGRAN